MDIKTANISGNHSIDTGKMTNKFLFADDTVNITNSTGLNAFLTGNFTDDQMLTTTTADGLNISSTECKNDYCVSDEQYINMISDYISPTTFEWCLIVAYFFVFITGLMGNFLVCFAVWRNHSMRTVTNYFIVNLAVADFLVILVCLPPTLLSDVTETWYMGSVMCKVVKYFQAASVAVSVLTLSAISVERYYAICQPLQFKATPTRAKYMILLTWFVGVVITLPELVVLDTMTPHGELTILLTACRPTWPDTYQGAYQCFLITTMYLLPFLLMFVTYFLIARTLWSNTIPTESSRDCLHPPENTQSMALLHTRRNVAKMLISVVVMFGICYLPVHLLNILRYTGALVSLGQLSIYFALIAHWLCYFNSAINPVIYNFMSAKFRKEFLKAFICCGSVCGSGNPTALNSTSQGHPNSRYLYRYHNATGYQNGRQLHQHWHGPINERRTVAETFYVTKT